MSVLRDVIDALLPPTEERRLIRIDAGMSIATLASILDVSVQTIENWEGGGTPESQNAIKYGRALRSLQGRPQIAEVTITNAEPQGIHALIPEADTDA